LFLTHTPSPILILIPILTIVIVILLFGTKKLRTLGQDLGNAVKSFREGLEEKNDDDGKDGDEDKDG